MAPRRVIGVDLGGTKLLAGVVDASLNVHHRAHRHARSDALSSVLDAVGEALDAASEEEVLAVGVGVPLGVDAARLRDVLAERVGQQLVVEREANGAMLAESRFGAAAGASAAVMLTLGPAVGGALLLDGTLVRGAAGLAGELGHMVVDLDGPPCACGNAGCLETMVSSVALGLEGERVARAASSSLLGAVAAEGRSITGMLVTELAFDGDRAARDVVALIGTRLGVGIASLVNAFNPSVVVVGGPLVAAGDMLLSPARSVVRERALSPVEIVAARFGAESSMLGAALSALDLVAPPAAAV